MSIKKKVLVVDDEPEIVILVKSRLEANGFEAIGADNGKEAIEKALTENPDIILLDLLMPVMDGYEAMNHLKKHEETKDIPIILFTAAPPEKVIKKGDDTMNAIDFVMKPFDDGALSTLLKRVKQITNCD
ncbi:MAG: response regulator [Candidatus Aureabacteria bacterium]|nr:response regulator [Candidatus Auribacterota bacterium]